MKFIFGVTFAVLLFGTTAVHVQVNAAGSATTHAKGNKLSLGGYGEATYLRNFYGDNGNRYTTLGLHKKDPSHGRFDIPHVVIYLSYDFGKGWSLGSEIEFEHGSSGSVIECEVDEVIEFEYEIERGEEAELEQFWLRKSLSKTFNTRAGHIVVPFGLVNAHHESLNFFTIYRPEGESTTLPSIQHQTGISFWGKAGDSSYVVRMITGLDAYHFNRANWIQKGTPSLFEFEAANKHGLLARVDNHTTSGPRIGVSGYVGQAIHDSAPYDSEKGEKKRTKGNIYLGSSDFTYDKYNWIARRNIDYGHVSSAQEIPQLSYPNVQYAKPYEPSNGKYFGSHAIAVMFEVGYDIFPQVHKVREDNQRLYVFGHIEHCDSYIYATIKQWTNRTVLATGINCYPISQIAIKIEYNYRNLKKGYNDEPSINIGITYEGFFL